MARFFRLTCCAEHVALVEDLLRAQGFGFTAEPFSPWTYRLVEQPLPLGRSIAAAFGLIYIQDRSSMLAPLFLQPEQGAVVLDMCASPGSKTGFLAQLVGPAGLVLANEPNDRRLATLRHNLAAMNLAQTATCRFPGQGLPWPGAHLRFVQLDPPCSGWGTQERNPRIREIWPEHKLKPLITLQRELLRQAAGMLAPGGRLLYSTCTTNPEENHKQVEWAIEHLDMTAVPLPNLPGVDRAGPAGQNPWLQVNPDSSQGQGFFFAALARSNVQPAPCCVGLDRWETFGERVDVRKLSRSDQIAWQRLPPGRIADFQGRIMFLHEKTACFPETLRWQGFELGRRHDQTLRLNTRLRLLVPEYSPGRGINIDEVEELQALLEGRSLTLPCLDKDQLQAGQTGLYWRHVPLGWATLKGRRCLWSPR